VPDTVANLGKRLKQIRLRKGLTQEALSARSGLTKSYVSLLEAGKKTPAISTLSDIAAALGTTLGELFENAEETSAVAVVKRDERFQVARKGTPFGYVYESLSLSTRNRIMVPFIVTVLPDNKKKRKSVEFQHAGEEFDFVLEGRIKYTIDDQDFVLDAGDSIYFDSSLRHRVEALDNRPAVTLSVHAERT
jgi:transcriptional regulator with XRE-family HTH domain